MRCAGFALLAGVMVVAAASAQPPVVPGTPPMPPPLPVAAVGDPALDAHLDGWEKTMTGLKSFFFKMELVRTNPAAAGVFKNKQVFTGQILGMKPNLARMRLEDKENPKDFEAFICTGDKVFAYNGLQKTITEHKLPDPKTSPAGATDHIILDFVSGMKKKDIKDRFEIKIFKEDKDYIYLDIKPKLGKDRQEFDQLRLALYQPRHATVAYLPAQIFMVRPNGETEQWMLSEPKTNIAELDPRKVFKYEDVPGFKFQQAPAQGPPGGIRPGVPTPPPLKRP